MPIFAPSPIDLLEPDQASKMIASMSLADYHDACAYQDLGRSWEASSAIKLGSVGGFLAPMDEKWIELAYITSRGKSYYESTGWKCRNSLIMENGWTRVHSDMEPIYANHSNWTRLTDYPEWLSQANYIFSCLNIASNRQHAADLLLDDATVLQQLDSVAYWSLDPAGIERLSAEDAKDLGFPAIKLKMRAYGQSWNDSVYDGLREFHQAKGFDPDSQDVARHLGHSLYEVSPDVPPGFSFASDGGRESDDGDSVALSHGGDDDESAHEQSNSISTDAPVAHTSTSEETSTVRDIDSMEILPPSRSLTIIMSVQFTLILTVGAFWLYENVFV
ncbi:hypothetical protein GGX14DRAFT_427443 [Mycena pura]|uniref:Uncharacterized protein n=1 Tax=Mycena pura TaxID=153505 RepID=A0AAD6YM20_9AGAR|nr:hypothetical protein GGX14DRAFT_427443 [Mycena pura]